MVIYQVFLLSLFRLLGGSLSHECTVVCNGTRSYITDDEPLLNLTGYAPLLKREGAHMYTKEGTEVPSLNTGDLVCPR